MRNLSKDDIRNIDKLLSIEEFEELIKNENVKLYKFEGEYFYRCKKGSECSKYSCY